MTSAAAVTSTLAHSLARRARRHAGDPRNWTNKWRIAVLTLAVFAALC